jgi:hypothetical protein
LKAPFGGNIKRPDRDMVMSEFHAYVTIEQVVKNTESSSPDIFGIASIGFAVSRPRQVINYTAFSSLHGVGFFLYIID